MKVTDISFSHSAIFISYVDGESEGQIRWCGEILTNGFGVYPLSAEQIKPVTWERLSSSYFRDIEVTRKLDESEYPALKQAIKEYEITASIEPIEF